MRIGDYIAMIHDFFGGFPISPDATWIEIKNLDFELVILANLNIQTCKVFFVLSSFFSWINIVHSSFYRMYVLIQFVLFCQTLVV